ncbi:DinB family protein [Arthrobacter sp. NPDC090010]|uniref:DinB family protein n=1 Tax=Arthrobacter sp. NPDC090010 TaxID=3363942 RepID=UPI003813BC46
MVPAIVPGGIILLRSVPIAWSMGQMRRARQNRPAAVSTPSHSDGGALTTKRTDVVEMYCEEMGRSERIADQLDRHWHKNLRPRLHGLSDEEYFWEPVRDCWSIRPPGTSGVSMPAHSGNWTMDSVSPAPVPAPVTTIAWRLAHIIVSCLGYRVGWHFGGQDIDSETFAYAGSADEALE